MTETEKLQATVEHLQKRILELEMQLDRLRYLATPAREPNPWRPEYAPTRVNWHDATRSLGSGG